MYSFSGEGVLVGVLGRGIDQEVGALVVGEGTGLGLGAGGDTVRGLGRPSRRGTGLGTTSGWDLGQEVGLVKGLRVWVRTRRTSRMPSRSTSGRGGVKFGGPDLGGS